MSVGCALQASAAVKLTTSAGTLPAKMCFPAQLLEERFFDDTKFFQVLDTPRVKLAQGGVSGDPEVQKKWKHAIVKDDPRLVTNKRGTFSFASAMPNSRTPQFIINLSNNGRMMDGRGPYGMVCQLPPPSYHRSQLLNLSVFADNNAQCPIGEVVEGIDVLDNLQKTKMVKSEEIESIMNFGNKWADEWNPDLSYIKTARIRESSDVDTAGSDGARANKHDL